MSSADEHRTVLPDRTRTTPPLGIVEGYYGLAWSDDARRETIATLAPAGYRFFIHAPKANPWLRRRWREPMPADELSRIAALAAHCRDCGVEFGIGLSPLGSEQAVDDALRAALASRLAAFDDLGVDRLAILFDDVPGSSDTLPERQADLMHWVAARTQATRVIACPSYYSDDPILEVVFGPRPERYLERLGRALDPSIDLFWTGEEVCARAIGVSHLERVATQMRRLPLLWDNYPVNDGARMSQYLHLRGFTGRQPAAAPWLRGHAINPSLQPVLFRIPALTLAESYRLGDAYTYREAFARAATVVAGAEVGRMLEQDLLILQDVGLDRLGKRAAQLRERYGGIDAPAAREIIAWLDGAWRIGEDEVATQ